MGREAFTKVDVSGEVGDVKVLLEAEELLLRGDIRRRFPRKDLHNVRVEGGALRFTCGGEDVALLLGSFLADKWAKAIATPPPTLRTKLGLAGDARAYWVGTFGDAALEGALTGALVNSIADANMMIACVGSPADLRDALAVHAANPVVPIWAIYAKGRGVAFGDAEIRAELRSLGFRDSKACGVSERLTATRYGRATTPLSGP